MDLVDVDDLTTDELHAVLDRAAELKAAEKDRAAELKAAEKDRAAELKAAQTGEGRSDPGRPLADQTLGMIFEKPSTRTRVSFETGMTQLGGHAIFLGPDDIHLGHGEPVKDTARAVSRYVDFIMARVFDHADVIELAEYASVPVVNGLTDDAHPCQTLADLLTLREHFGFDTSVAWVGDGNNVCQSFVLGAAMTDLEVTVATPEGYGVDEDVLKRAEDLGGRPETTADPDAAIADADVVYTDVWVSMGQEDERAQKLDDFEGFQLTTDRIGDRTVMHCLPAHRGEEITDDVLESENAIVWDQAENRLHAQKGLLVWLSEQ